MNGNNLMNEDRLSGSATDMQAVESKQVENIERPEPAATSESVKSGPLAWLKDEEIDELQSRWNSAQIEFVDDPRTSVEHASALMAEAVDRIEHGFSTQRMMLDQQWINREDISTEDLRVALQNYRSFLNRLLAL